MASGFERFKSIPTTSRGGEFLAQKHGFDSITSLADSLPAHANVIDIGAGASPFGKVIAKLRPDLHWTNFDLSYHNPEILAEASAGAPDNVAFTPGDATKLSEHYEADSFDAVFSYWLFPHLSLYSKAPAREAARGLYKIAKYTGYLSVGPARTDRRSAADFRKHTHRTIKSDQTEDEFVADTVAKTQLRGFHRIFQRVNNEVTAKTFETSRHIKRVPGKHLLQMQDPRSEKYHSVLHPASILTTMRAELDLPHVLLRREVYQKVEE